MNWIPIETEECLPQIKGSCLCWVTIKGKVSLAVYQSKYFEVRAEYGLYEWKLVSHYILIEKPEAPAALSS